MEELRQDFPPIITDWEYVRQVDTNALFITSLKSGLDDYSIAMWLLSQAYLLGVEESVLKRTLACIGSDG